MKHDTAKAPSFFPQFVNVRIAGDTESADVLAEFVDFGFGHGASTCLPNQVAIGTVSA